MPVAAPASAIACAAGIGTITMASLQRSMPLHWRIEMARTVV